MNKPILFVNACVRKESRTRRLAEKLLKALDQPFDEIRLNEIGFPVMDGEMLDTRNRLIADRCYHDSMFDLARQFSEADTIVIAAPFWDLSFPAALKQSVS